MKKMVTSKEFIKKHCSRKNIRFVDERVLKEKYAKYLLEKAKKIVIEKLNSDNGGELEGYDDVYYMLVRIVEKDKKKYGYEFGEEFSIVFDDEGFPKEEFINWLQSYGWKLIVDDTEDWLAIEIITPMYEEYTGLKLPFEDEEDS